MHDVLTIRNGNKPATADEMYGFAREAQFLRAWRKRWHHRQPHNQWLIEVVLSSYEEDHKFGTDAAMVTKFPEHLSRIPVQIKSSFNKAMEFESIHRYVPVVLIHPDDTDLLIRQKTIFAIIRKYPSLRNLIQGTGCTISDRIIRALSDDGTLFLKAA